MNPFEDVTQRSEWAEGLKPRLDDLRGSTRGTDAGLRRLLEQWGRKFPPEVQAIVNSCFHTKDNGQHLHAFFELYLLELFSKLGFGIEFHPPGEEKGTLPKFQVLKGEKPLLYLTATVALPFQGQRAPGPGANSPHLQIRQSIQDVASQCGKVDLPFIIAMDVISELGVDDIDISNALLGEEQSSVVFRDNSPLRRRPGRKRNGAWRGPKGPVNRRVSAVLVAVNLSPWNFAKVIPRLWHNPWAKYPLTQDIWPLPQLVPE